MGELRVLVEVECFDVLLVTETWFGEKSVVNLEGYSLSRRDRPTGHGGVCIYVREELNSRESAVLGDFEHSEQIWCEISPSPSESILVGCIYRPPSSSNSLEQANEINSALCKARHHLDSGRVQGVLVGGDFNFPKIEWFYGAASVPRGCKLEDDFVRSMNDNFFYQSVLSPTFVYTNGELGNILDLVISENLDRISEVCFDSPLGRCKQGHLQLRWCYKLASKRVIKFIRSPYNWKKGKYSELNKFFLSVNWREMLVGLEVQRQLDLFAKVYWDGVNKFIPIVNRSREHKKRSSEPWVTASIKRISAAKRRLWYKYRASNRKNVELLSEYKVTCKILKAEVAKSIVEFELNLAKDSDLKRLFQYVNRRQKVDSRVNALRDLSGNTVTNGVEISNVLNLWFKSVFIHEDTSHLPLFEPLKIKHLMSDSVEVTAYEISLILAGLDQYKAPGEDGFHPFVLHNTAESLAFPLEILFNNSLASGIVPHQWLVANVTPLFKGGSKLEPSNYRPVSLTSVICKVLERCIRSRIMCHMIKNNLLTPEQHGFVLA